MQFVHELFKVDPDPWQREALEAFPDPRKQRISLQACAGPGKTAVMAWCTWNFLQCYGGHGEHPNGAAVSITNDNLKDNLWKELAKWQQRSELLTRTFTWSSDRIAARDHPETWWLSARGWPKTANADEQGKTLSGLHSKFILAAIDESGAIPTTVLRAAEQALATGPWFGKILQAGNPISLDGMLYEAATLLRGQWHVIRITGDPDDPRAWIYAPRLAALHKADDELCSCPQCWARRQIKTYGRENPWVKSYILGEFPTASLNSLLGVDEVEASMNRHLREDVYVWAQKRLGIDVARYGDDRTVIFPRQGLASFRPIVMRHERGSAVSTDIANAVLRAKLTWGSELEFIDATGGWGAGARDALMTAGHCPIDVQFATRLPGKYYNKRAANYFALAEWVKRGAALPPIREMVPELTKLTYTFHKGQFMMEEKDQLKKRIGVSPDYSDGLSTTFDMPDMAAGFRQLSALEAQGAAHALTERDPYRVEA